MPRGWGRSLVGQTSLAYAFLLWGAHGALVPLLQASAVPDTNWFESDLLLPVGSLLVPMHLFGMTMLFWLLNPTKPEDRGEYDVSRIVGLLGYLGAPLGLLLTQGWTDPTTWYWAAGWVLVAIVGAALGRGNRGAAPDRPAFTAPQFVTFFTSLQFTAVAIGLLPILLGLCEAVVAVAWLSALQHSGPAPLLSDAIDSVQSVTILYLLGTALQIATAIGLYAGLRTSAQPEETVCSVCWKSAPTRSPQRATSPPPPTRLW